MSDVVALAGIASCLRLEQRRYALRQRVFGARMPREASWHMLIDLRAAEIEGRPISISSACVASGYAGTTALRQISFLERDGRLERRPDRTDRRRSHLLLAEATRASIDEYARRAGALQPLPVEFAEPGVPGPIQAAAAFAAIGSILARVRA